MSEKNAPDLNLEKYREILWNNLFTGKAHIEDLLALEAAGKRTGFKPGKLKKELREIEAAMGLLRIA